MGISCSRRHVARIESSSTLLAAPVRGASQLPTEAVDGTSAGSDDFGFELVTDPEAVVTTNSSLPIAVRRQQASQGVYSGGYGRPALRAAPEPIGAVPQQFEPTPLRTLRFPTQTLPAASNLGVTNLRLYAVWYLPGSPALAGIHWASPPCALAAWQGVRSLAYYSAAQSGGLASEGWRTLRWARIQNVTSREQAEAVYLAEANRNYVHWFFWD